MLFQVFEHLGEPKPPKFTLIVAQKNHHTKLFLADGSKNVPPGSSVNWKNLFIAGCTASPDSVCFVVFVTGTVVDTMVVHPRNYDFYMCPQAGMIVSFPLHVFR